jgi:glycosyltransferase involved in cell wall biosynthesis
MNRIHVLFCIHDLRGRGAEKVLATLLEKFDRNRYRIGVFVFHDNYTVKIPDDVDIVSAHLKPYPQSASVLFKLKMNLHKVGALGKAIRTHGPAVAISISGTNIPIVVAKRLFRLKTKVILSEHTMLSAFTKDSGGRLAQFLTRKLISISYPIADFVVIPSVAVSNDLQTNYGLPREKLIFIPNPLDIDFVRNSANEKSDFVFPEENHFKVGFLGGLSKEKNIPCLLKAFSSLRSKRLHARLYIVGEGIEEENLRILSENLGIKEHVHFLGYRNNPYPILKSLNALVVSSFYETFSYVMLEAMVCGVPVVSSRWPGCEDIYTDNENCLLFPVNDHERLAEAVEKLMTREHLANNLRENGLKFIRQYDASDVAEQYDLLIRRFSNG